MRWPRLMIGGLTFGVPTFGVLTFSVLLLAACAPGSARSEGPEGSGSEPLAITEVLAGDATGFARADAPRNFRFPADHGAHPRFRSEWWYFTGHLRDEIGGTYGFQLTFFRSALAPAPAPAEVESAVNSEWRTRQAWMGHLAVGDFGADAFYARERFARGGRFGLAGAAADAFGVWLEGWSAEAVDPADPDSPIRLVAAQDGVALDLTLTPRSAPWLQGVDGLSQKGPDPGQASYYYSVPRWGATGSVRVPAGQAAVTGTAWADREWGSSALAPGSIGWDWFALNLEDGSDLMLYLMRRDDGSIGAASSGAWRDADGTVERLAASDFEVEILDTWSSPSGERYPARWRLHVPALDLVLEIAPLRADQQLDLSFRYWEGAVRARGTRRGAPVDGRGFVELTGY